ncbi:MAG: hypothetical protein ACFFD4_32915 [Candidatus Odinarchaeota archaeon]
MTPATGILKNQLSFARSRYFFISEIKLKIRSSALLWLYIASVFLVIIPDLLRGRGMYYSHPVNYQTIIILQLVIMFLFFPMNHDVFMRERELDLLDFLSMRETNFRTIYTARIGAQAFLMVSPPVLALSCFSIKDFSVLNIVQGIQNLFIPVIALPFFYFWFLTSMLVQFILEFRFTESLVRAFIYYGIVFSLAGVFFIFIDVLVQAAFTAALKYVPAVILLSVFLIVTGYLLLHFFLRQLLGMKIDKLAGETRNPDQKRIKKDFFLYSYKKKFFEVYSPIDTSTLKKKIPLLVSLVFLLSFMDFEFLLPSMHDVETGIYNYLFTLLTAYSIYILLLLFYVMIVIFPRITAEKEFNMEELLLSKVSAASYFAQKVNLLVNYLVSRLVVVTSVVLLISFTLSFPHINLPIGVALFVMIHIFYFIAILLFTWRMFPRKNLLQTAILTIIGADIFGIVLTPFIGPVLFGVSPLFSILAMPLCQLLAIDPSNKDQFGNTDRMPTLFADSMLSITVLLAVILFFSAYLLIKSEINYE